MKERVWITSDTHFNHKNIIKYCNRPFVDVENMNKELIERWNNTVAKDDIVYHLGDFMLGSRSGLNTMVSKLNGRINIVLGNHDNLKYMDYINAGFNRVYDRPVLIQDYIILSHAPKFTNLSTPYINIFGHVHDDPNIMTISPTGACVCCERWDYKPVLLDDILKRIKEERNKN